MSGRIKHQVSDPFRVLGLPSTASEADVRSAFHRLAKTHHPDVSHEPNAAERFLRIQEAYNEAVDVAKARSAAPTNPGVNGQTAYDAERMAARVRLFRQRAAGMSPVHEGVDQAARVAAIWARLERFVDVRALMGLPIFIGATYLVIRSSEQHLAKEQQARAERQAALNARVQSTSASSASRADAAAAAAASAAAAAREAQDMARVERERLRKHLLSLPVSPSVPSQLSSSSSSSSSLFAPQSRVKPASAASEGAATSFNVPSQVGGTSSAAVSIQHSDGEHVRATSESTISPPPQSQPASWLGWASWLGLAGTHPASERADSQQGAALLGRESSQPEGAEGPHELVVHQPSSVRV